MKTLTFLLVLLVGCGAEQQPVDSIADLAQQKTDQNQPGETEQQGTNEPTFATLVESEDTRPACKVKAQLIYVLNIKQFQACDGKGTWEKADVNQTVINNTEEKVTKVENTTNVNAEANVITDDQGNDWIIYQNVQKSNVARKKVCPTGYTVATLAQIQTVILTTLFQGFLTNQSFVVVTSDAKAIALYILNGTTTVYSVVYSDAQYDAIKSLQANAMCIKPAA